MSERESLILIGMPGAGKSTVGVLLAKRLAMAFVDTDLLIQQRAGLTLQQIVDREGHLGLRALEEQVLCELPEEGARVIATGGSAVYSQSAMARLKSLGRCIYLACPFDVIEKRITNEDSRGLARHPGQGLQALFHEREPLYRRYADLVVDCGALTPEKVVAAICERLSHCG